jgi:PKD repeat protein
MSSPAGTIVVVLLSVLGATVGGGVPAWADAAPDDVDRRAVGPSTVPFASALDDLGDDLPVLVALQAAPASVTFEDQTTDGRTVTVAAVTLPDGGFVTVHDEGLAKGEPFTSVRGTTTYLPPGSHDDVTVVLDDPIEATQRLIAVPYRDTDSDGVYDYVSTGGGEDVPYESARGVVVSDVATVAVNEPPRAALQFSPVDPRPGETVAFDGIDSEDDDGRVVRYDWRVRGSNPPLLVAFTSDNVTTFEYAFRTVGRYEVQLTVTDDDGARDTATTTVVVRENAPPTAAFEFAPVDPAVGETVRFDGTVSTDDRGVVSYLWDLDGDGDFDTDDGRVTRSYAAAGRYPVTLLVSDGEGEVDRTTLTVTVSEANTPPVATFGFSPPEPVADEVVSFDAADSTDPDAGDTVVSYRWTVDGAFVDEDDAPGFTYRFPEPGVYDVTLTVTDTRGATGRTTERVVVGEATRPPTARLDVSPAVPTVGDPVTFDATGSTDDGEILAHRWDLDGDGTFEATGPVVERRFPGGGTFVVALLVIDDDGETDTANATLRVNEPPEPAFRVEPPDPRVGERVTLDASPSSDDRRIVGYAWDADGDGTFESTGRAVSREFEAAGEYAVTLAVTDDDGVTTRTTRTVTVEASSRPDAETTAPDADGDDSSAASDGGPDDAVTAAPTDTGTDTPVVPRDRESDWPLPGTPGDAAAAGGAAVAVVLVVLFRDELAGLLRGLELPRRLPRTTPRRGGRTRPVRDVPDPDETEEDEEEPNRPPRASVRYAPEEPVVGRPVRFDGLGSVDPDGRVVGYRWTFDDAERAGAMAVHVFEADGEHEVTLAVEDDDGATDEATVTVEVEPGEGELALADVHPDSPGRDHDNLHLEYLVFENVGEGPLDVEGWTVHDAAEEEERVREGEHTYAFEEELELAPGATVALYTGAAPEDAPVPPDIDEAHHRYWERTWPVWNNEGDVVVVKDAEGNPVLAARYRPAGDGYAVESLDPERLELLFPDVEPPAEPGDVGGT